MNNTVGNIIESVRDLILGTAKPVELTEKNRTLVLPPGYSQLDLESRLPLPARPRGTVMCADMNSLIGYLSGYAVQASSAVCFVVGPGQVSVILNHHDRDELEAGWSDWRVQYSAEEDLQWIEFWSGIAGKWISQTAFAEWVEDNYLSFISPSPADMLDLSRTFEAQKECSFKSGIRLQNGDHSLHWVATTSAKAGASGELEIPATVKIMLLPWRGGAFMEVETRFRYRIDDGNLKVCLKPVAPKANYIATARETFAAGVKAEMDKLGILTVVGTLG